jgi:hypothetical protein
MKSDIVLPHTREAATKSGTAVNRLIAQVILRATDGRLSLGNRIKWDRSDCPYRLLPAIHDKAQGI